MSVKVLMRNLQQRFKVFFNLESIRALSITPELRVVVPFEELHTLVEKVNTPGILLTTTGPKAGPAVKEGQIWAPEVIIVQLTSGTTARLNDMYIQRKSGINEYAFSGPVTPDVYVRLVRGVHYSENLRLYEGDTLNAICSTGNAGDIGEIQVYVKVMYVGD